MESPAANACGQAKEYTKGTKVTMPGRLGEKDSGQNGEGGKEHNEVYFDNTPQRHQENKEEKDKNYSPQPWALAYRWYVFCQPTGLFTHQPVDGAQEGIKGAEPTAVEAPPKGSYEQESHHD
jgi:hypothetical protein